MRIVVAPDSFKESMTAAEAAAAMARGVRAVVPDAEVVEIPNLLLLEEVPKVEMVQVEISNLLFNDVQGAVDADPDD